MTTKKPIKVELSSYLKLIDNSVNELRDICDELMDSVLDYLVKLGIVFTRISINEIINKNIRQVCVDHKPVYQITVDFDKENNKIQVNGFPL